MIKDERMTKVVLTTYKSQVGHEVSKLWVMIMTSRNHEIKSHDISQNYEINEKIHFFHDFDLSHNWPFISELSSHTI